MTQIVNNGVISTANLYSVNGTMCVRAQGLLPNDISNKTFEATFGFSVDFIREWAANQYAVLVNDWLIKPIATHVSFDEDGVFAVTFVINNAVVEGLKGTYAYYQLSLEGGEVKVEITETEPANDGNDDGNDDGNA